MKQLIKMSDYVLLPFLHKVSREELSNTKPEDYKLRDWELTISYAKFLQTPLKIEMFVPINEKGNILFDPKEMLWPASMSAAKDMEAYQAKYRKAQEDVLFKGFSIGPGGLYISDVHDIVHIAWFQHPPAKVKWKFSNGLKTIEDLIPYKLELTKELS